MVHGMWCGKWSWKEYRAFFEEKGYRCRVPVLRHHDIDAGSKPDPLLGTTSLLDYAADLQKEIEALGERPIIMGHSMGGLLAQILGARGLARALVLLTPASPSGIIALTPSVVRCFWSVLTRWGFWRQSNRPSLKESVYSMLHLMPDDEQRIIHSRLVHESGRAAGEIGFWPLDPHHATKVDEKRLDCPVLVIAGSEDRITPASVVKKVAVKYKNVSSYLEFENHAHWVLGEPGWEEIADSVEQWIRGQVTDSANTSK